MGDNNLYDSGALLFLYLRNASVILLPGLIICFIVLFCKRYQNNRGTKRLTVTISGIVLLLTIIPIAVMLTENDWVVSAATLMIYPTFTFLVLPPSFSLFLYLFYQSIKESKKKRILKSVFIAAGILCFLIWFALLLVFVISI